MFRRRTLVIATTQLSDETALLAFAERAGFPEHALILRKSRDSNDRIHKGISDRSVLLETFRTLRPSRPTSLSKWEEG